MGRADLISANAKSKIFSASSKSSRVSLEIEVNPCSVFSVVRDVPVRGMKQA